MEYTHTINVILCIMQLVLLFPFLTLHIYFAHDLCIGVYDKSPKAFKCTLKREILKNVIMFRVAEKKIIHHCVLHPPTPVSHAASISLSDSQEKVRVREVYV